MEYQARLEIQTSEGNAKWAVPKRAFVRQDSQTTCLIVEEPGDDPVGRDSRKFLLLVIEESHSTSQKQCLTDQMMLSITFMGALLPLVMYGNTERYKHGWGDRLMKIVK